MEVTMILLLGLIFGLIVVILILLMLIVRKNQELDALEKTCEALLNELRPFLEIYKRNKKEFENE